MFFFKSKIKRMIKIANLLEEKVIHIQKKKTLLAIFNYL